MLKLIAALLMVVDHAGLIFFAPTSSIYVLCRLIGRLSMPIFAYKLASGALYTKHFKRYASRLLAMTLFAQIPFTWLIYRDQFWETLQRTNGLCLFQYWNIGLTFLCALLILKLLNHLSLPSLLLIGLLAFVGNSGDYGIYGIGLVILFYYYQKNTFSFGYCSVLFFALCVLHSLSWGLGFLNVALSNTLPALLSLFLMRYVPDTSIKLPKNFFYIFYPAHMLVLLILSTLFS